MDKVCLDCPVPVSSKGTRCKKHAAVERWRTQTTPRYCKTCTGLITSRTKARAVYCCRACKFADPEMRARMAVPTKRVAKVCPHCWTEFHVPVSNDSRFNYCSRACSREARGRDAKCRRCGAMFRHGLAVANRGYCSEVCRRPPLLVTCDHCTTEFRIVPSLSWKRRYCSQRCYMASGLETSIERTVRLRLEALDLDFLPQAQIGRWIVDFLVGHQLVIEADGSYWHSLRPDVDRRKTAELVGRGYVVWRLPEEQIRHPEFAASLQTRLADYERAHGEFARVAPGELTAVLDGEHRVVPRYEQLALAI